MSLEDLKTYISDLCVQVYGVKPKDVVPFQTILENNLSISGKFFVTSYFGNGTLSFNNSLFTNAIYGAVMPGNVSGIDFATTGFLVHEITVSATGHYIVGGFQCSF